MRKQLLILLCFFLCGCNSLDNQQSKEITISSYHVQQATFRMLPPTAYDKGQDVYDIRDEVELSRLMQSHYDNKESTIVFQSEREMDLNQVNEILSHINAFDIKLSQTTNEYRNKNNELVYQSYTLTMDNMDETYEEASNFAKQILPDIIDETMTDIEKIRAVYHFLMQHIEYDVHASSNKADNPAVFSAYGAFVNKKAVCTGYARAFMIFMEELNLPCIYISSKEMDHSWNMVKIENEWKYFDVTWDDHGDGMFHYDYFNLSKEDFYRDGKHRLDYDRGMEFYSNLSHSFF